MFAKVVLLAATLSGVLTLLAACGSPSGTTYTPQELQFGVGCHRGPNVDTYCD